MPRKASTFNPSEPYRVEVYWNLHKHCWSVRSTKTGRLIPVGCHREYLHLMGVRWVVQPGGRRRVLETGKKNVHAFARGWLLPETGDYSAFLVDAEENMDSDAVTYNPFKMETFQNRETGETIRESEKAYLYSVDGRPRTNAVRAS